MKVTFFLLLVAAVAFLAVFQPAVEAAPQDAGAEVGAAVMPGGEAEGTEKKPEGGAGAGAESSSEDGHGKGKGKGKGKCHGKGKGGEKGAEKGAKGKANKENGAKGQANKGKGQGKGKN